MLKITLVRHGSTDWNVMKRFQGHTDIPLNAKGVEQARKAAKELADEQFDAIVSSDLSRCRQTAEILCAGREQQITFDPRWREFHFGAWEGLTWEEIVANQLDEIEGVSFGTQEHQRVKDLLTEAVKELHEKKYQDVLVVTHFGPISTLLGILDPMEKACEYIELGSILRLSRYRLQKRVSTTTAPGGSGET